MGDCSVSTYVSNFSRAVWKSAQCDTQIVTIRRIELGGSIMTIPRNAGLQMSFVPITREDAGTPVRQIEFLLGNYFSLFLPTGQPLESLLECPMCFTRLDQVPLLANRSLLIPLASCFHLKVI